jgi:hypothetical protein
MAARSVQITGLKELQAALRRMDADLPKQIRVALNSAGQVVLDYAQPKVPTRTGAARGSMKLRSSQREARLAAGGRRAPYYPWLDFGGQVGPPGPRRPFRREGRYIYVAVRQEQAKIQEALQKALSDLIRSAGLEES